MGDSDSRSLIPMGFEDDEEHQIMQPIDSSDSAVAFDDDEAHAATFVCLVLVCVVGVAATGYFFWHLLHELEAPRHFNQSV